MPFIVCSTEGLCRALTAIVLDRVHPSSTTVPGFFGLMHQEHGSLNSVHSSCSNPQNGPVDGQARWQTSAFLPLIRRDAWKSALYGSEPSLPRSEEASMEPFHTGPRRRVFSALPPSSAPAMRCLAASLRHTRHSESYDGCERPLPSATRLLPPHALQHPF